VTEYQFIHLADLTTHVLFYHVNINTAIFCCGEWLFIWQLAVAGQDKPVVEEKR